ncbi:MAG: inorganic phosphate transporter [Gammaproteobacteria bacterium]|nr:inorganic phosphate transporter [Gammaproteobacteria bacterium]
MDLTVLILLGSGLFLGWSLGANDAANVFGTAVGTRMVRFGTAAAVCSVFVILGAVVSGAGAAHTLSKLGSIDAIAGSFMAALAAAITVYGMTRSGLPVSTSQAIVGAIIGWNLFSNSVTDTQVLLKIMFTWMACPILAGLIAVILFKLVRWILNKANLHLLRLDAYTRLALIGAGAFGAYSLGANNIANVMGVFVPVSPFTDFALTEQFTLTSVQQLFLLGSIAIAVGVFTYSKRVMLTVGNELMPMSPVTAWVVVVAHSIVLFLFSSQGLEHALAEAGLPTIPLVPVSSSQAVIGAVIGLGLLRGGRNIRWGLLVQIGTGWVITPFLAAAMCFVGLFFLQNVFDQQVHRSLRFELTPRVVERMSEQGVPKAAYADLVGRSYESSGALLDAMTKGMPLTGKQTRTAIDHARIQHTEITEIKLSRYDFSRLSEVQRIALQKLAGQQYQYAWELAEALSALSPQWQRLPAIALNRRFNKRLDEDLAYLIQTFESR